jgi:hypothetical protein
MIIFERLGGWGLGNSLFQIATTIAIANDNNTQSYFPSNCYFNRQRYNNSLFKNDLCWIDLNPNINYERWGTGDIRYIQPPKFNNDVIIDGFFQSEKYFKHIRHKIIDQFSLKDDILSTLKIKYDNIILEKSCTLHVRRTDYITADELRVLDMEYYKKAVSYFNPDTLFVIFSDDIKWCKENFDWIYNKIFIEENNDLLEMHLMSLFKNNIIANSTFSWWGAWLGNMNRVIMPDPSNNWFSDAFYDRNKYDFNDLIVDNWIVI